MQVRVRKPLDLQNFQCDTEAELADLKKLEGETFTAVQISGTLCTIDTPLAHCQLFQLGADCDEVE